MSAISCCKKYPDSGPHPRQPWFGNWGYNLQRGEECAAKWREIPHDTDILITHGPPIGHGDRVRNGIRAG